MVAPVRAKNFRVGSLIRRSEVHLRRAFGAACAAALVFALTGLTASDALVIKQAPTIPRRASGAVRIARNAYRVAQKMHSVGKCYRGVTLTMRDFGVTLTGMAAYEAKDQLIRDHRFKLVNAQDLKDLRTGDILVNNAVSAHPYGHIAVYVGNEKEASDHIQPVVFNSHMFGKTIVFRLRSS